MNDGEQGIFMRRKRRERSGRRSGGKIVHEMGFHSKERMCPRIKGLGMPKKEGRGE